LSPVRLIPQTIITAVGYSCSKAYQSISLGTG